MPSASLAFPSARVVCGLMALLPVAGLAPSLPDVCVPHPLAPALGLIDPVVGPEWGREESRDRA